MSVSALATQGSKRLIRALQTGITAMGVTVTTQTPGDGKTFPQKVCGWVGVFGCSVCDLRVHVCTLHLRGCCAVRLLECAVCVHLTICARFARVGSMATVQHGGELSNSIPQMTCFVRTVARERGVGCFSCR
jgi:hypothetical protein